MFASRLGDCKKWWFAVLLIASIGSTAAQSASKPEQKVVVTTHRWVKVLNVSPIYNGNGTFQRGEPCSLKEGGILQVLERSRRRAIVLYTVDAEQYGAYCPSGVLFEILTNDTAA